MKNVRKFLRNPTAVVGLVILVTLRSEEHTSELQSPS